MNNNRRIAEESANLLLQALKRLAHFDVGCRRAQTKLTIYHLSAYRGLSGFVRILLNDTSLSGIDANCYNLHGITPLYLAKLSLGTTNTSEGERDYWQEVVDLIKSHGGVLSYPNREVELHIIYQHLYGSHLEPFTLGEFEADGEQFYKNEFSLCTEHDLRHYSAGTMINRHHEEFYAALRQIIKFLRSGVVVPEQRMIQQVLEVLLKRDLALQDLSALFDDVAEGLKEIELKLGRIRMNAITNKTSSLVAHYYYPNFVSADIIQKIFFAKNLSHHSQQLLRELNFKHRSWKAIDRHRIAYLKKFLYEYKDLFEDRKAFFNLLQKYERSELCEEEIFQATLLKSAFQTYVPKSRLDNPENLLRDRLEQAEFLTNRIPKEWRAEGEAGWNQAVKFLYQRATKKDLAFDYLKDLSLGYDPDTRIPLSAESLFWLHV